MHVLCSFDYLMVDARKRLSSISKWIGVRMIKLVIPLIVSDMYLIYLSRERGVQCIAIE